MSQFFTPVVPSVVCVGAARGDRIAPRVRFAYLAFALGVGGFHLLPGVPAPLGHPAALALLALALLTLALAAPLAWCRPWLRLPWILAAGLTWALLHSLDLLRAPFPDELIRVPLVVEGRIASIPVETGTARRFLFEVERTWRGDEPLPFRGLVRLSWYRDAPAELAVGERWRLGARLKPRHGYFNPGGFDFERWLFERGVKATGGIRRAPAPEWLDAGPGPRWLDRWRQALGERLALALGDHRALGLVQALTIGERSRFAPGDQELLNRTGTSHLVAISGLHVGLIAGLVFLLTRRLWSLSARLTLRLAAPRAAALTAGLAALVYAGLAGFAVSTERALIMLAVVFGALLWRRTLHPWQALTLALAGVLAADPRAVLSGGFWLSFGAVALLLFHLGQRLPPPRPAPGARDAVTLKTRLTAWVAGWPRTWRRLGQAQWAVGIGLAPLLFILFGQASVIAPLVNLAAIPLFGLLLPLVLLATLVSLAGGWHWPLHRVADLLAWCLDGLAGLAALPWAAQTLPDPPLWALVLAVAGALLLLAPRGLPGRWLGLVLLLPLALVRPPAPGHGELWFSLLDVGQGLAAVVRTRDGVLVYDAGPGFPSGFDTGEAVVAPFLRAHGIDRIDRLVISHADRDHAGGLPGLLDRIAVGQLDSGEPERLAPMLAPAQAPALDSAQAPIQEPVQVPAPAPIPEPTQEQEPAQAPALESVQAQTPAQELVQAPAQAPMLADRPGSPRPEPCRAGTGWTWSGVEFRYLHPERPDANSGNDASCVLQIRAGGRAILLTGDIGHRVERRLARQLGDELRSDILVAGHHGSATSTDEVFLDTVAPELALFSSGYANAFGHPAAEVRERIAARGIRMRDTALDGAIEIRVSPDGRLDGPRIWRERAGRLWTHRPERH